MGDKLGDDIFNRLLESLEEEIHQLDEDLFNGVLVKLGVHQQVVVSHLSSRDHRSSGAGKAHTGEHDNVFQVHPYQLLTVVPPLVIHVLSKDFDGRLGSIFFLLGHIEIIHEDDTLLSDRGAIEPFSSLFHLTVNGVLGLISGGLCGEGEGDVLERVPHSVDQQIIGILRLAGSSGTHAHHMVVVFKQSLHQEDISSGVNRGDHDFMILGASWNREVLNGLVPGLELLFSGVELIIVDAVDIWDTEGGLFQTHLLL